MRNLITFLVFACCAVFTTSAKEVWSIGSNNNTGADLALGPSDYKKFLAHDFGYEDR